MSNFGIIFFSSSDFTLPILKSIKDSQDNNLSLKDTFEAQKKLLKGFPDLLPANILATLDKKSIYEKIQPELEAKIKLQMVVTQPDRQIRKKTIANPISRFCQENRINLFQPQKINLELEKFRELKQNAGLGLVASYGQIISQQVLDSLEYGFINWHPSKLPKYRGPSPVQETLAKGEADTALSWIEMTKKMDAGNILLQVPQKIFGSDSFSNLINKFGLLGAKTWAIAAVIQILHNKGVKISLKQDEDLVTFSPMLNKERAIIDPNDLTAEQIFNHFRAYQNFPGSKFYSEYFQGLVKIASCRLFNADKSGSEVVFENRELFQIKESKKLTTLLRCKQNTYLELEEIILSSGKKVNLKGFVL